MKPDRRKARAGPSRSESTEDHLERIQELVDRKGYARVSDIAATLGLTRSTVSNMVRRLARRGFVNYERYRGFTLTSAGRRVAPRPIVTLATSLGPRDRATQLTIGTGQRRSRR